MFTRRSYDVVVLGTGPAGAAAAMVLSRRGANVAAISRRLDPRLPFVETLPPNVQNSFVALDLWSEFERLNPLPASGLLACWSSDEPEEYDYVERGHSNTGWHVSRSRLHDMLQQVLAKEALPLAYVDDVRLARPGKRWQIQTRSQAGCQSLWADFVIDATGRPLLAAHQQQTEPQANERLFALHAVVEATAQHAHDSRLLLEAAPNGWWYSAPCGSSKRFVCLVTHRTAFLKQLPLRHAWWRAQLSQTRLISRSVRCDRAVVVSGRSAPRGRVGAVAGPGWLAAGAAACGLDPLCGAGIIWALRSGAQCGQTILSARPHAVDDYADFVSEFYADHLRYRHGFYQRQPRWRDQPFWINQRDDGLSPSPVR